MIPGSHKGSACGGGLKGWSVMRPLAWKKEGSGRSAAGQGGDWASRVVGERELAGGQMASRAEGFRGRDFGVSNSPGMESDLKGKSKKERKKEREKLRRCSFRLRAFVISKGVSFTATRSVNPFPRLSSAVPSLLNDPKPHATVLPTHNIHNIHLTISIHNADLHSRRPSTPTSTVAEI